MKIAVIIVRVLMGLMYVMSAVVVLFNLMKEQPAMKPEMMKFMEGVMAVGYLLPLIKITELVCGLAFVIGRFVPLAAVVIFPVTLNIFLVNTLVDPKGAVIGVFMLAANLFIAWAHREKYKPMMVAK